MHIKELQISNYRSVPEEPIRFTPEMNFVIGENNTGKTSLLDCLERLFSKSTMPAGDFKDENSPITAFVTIHFEESEIGLCGDYADSGSHDELTICFSCESPDSDIVACHKESGEIIPLRNIRKLRFFKYSSALSDSQNLAFDRNRGVGRVLTRAFLKYQENSGKTTGDFIDDAEMAGLISYLNNTFGSLPILSDYGMHVSLDTTDKSALGSVVTLADGNDLHFQKVGSGVQYVAMLVLSVIDSMLRMSDKQREACIVEDEEEKRAFNCILSFDEPEAHLHPYMQRRLMKEISRITRGSNTQFNDLLKEFFDIDAFKAQVLVVTHSPHILQGGYKDIIHFYDTGAGHIAVTNGSDIQLTKASERHLATYFELMRESLFVKSVVLVEGISEQVALPLFSASLGIDVDEEGILVLQTGSRESIKPAQELLDAFGILNIAVIDRDDESECDSGPTRTTKYRDFEEEIIRSSFDQGKQDVLLEIIRKHSPRGLNQQIQDNAIHKYACKKLKLPEIAGGVWFSEDSFSGPAFALTDRTMSALYSWFQMEKGALLGKTIGLTMPKDCIPKCYEAVLKEAAGIGVINEE
jgi:putative ATP-dependent endonuclease of OLD family